MRVGLLIFVAVALSSVASWVLWREKLTPASLINAPPPTELQREFGWQMTGELAAAMDRHLPADFSCAGGLGPTVQRMRDATGAKIWVSWSNIAHVAHVTQQTPVTAPLAGMKLRNAIPAMLTSLPARAPLIAIANGDGVLEIELASQIIEETSSSIYDVRDLLPTTDVAATEGAAKRLIAEIEAQIPTKANDPRHRAPRIIFMKGDLLVMATPFVQYEVIRHLNRARMKRARWEFAKPTSALVGSSVASALLIYLMLMARTSRRARRLGLCRRCGYDLRASDGRCPECGAAVASSRAANGAA